MRNWTEARTLALLLAALVLLAGCSAPREVRVEAQAHNATGQTTQLLLKVWDHNGALVFNQTVALPAANSAAPTSVAVITGPTPTYGSKYAWFAQSGDLDTQVEQDPVGLTTWQIRLATTGITFEFA